MIDKLKLIHKTSGTLMTADVLKFKLASILMILSGFVGNFERYRPVK
ncbi:hypothetical protein [Thiomicrorhabdus indica]|nr:hypothetical protein [Thiomicrorhabdus indica]